MASCPRRLTAAPRWTGTPRPSAASSCSPASSPDFWSNRATIVFEKLVRLAPRKGEPFISFFDPREFPAAVSTLGYQFYQELRAPRQGTTILCRAHRRPKPGSQWRSYMAHFLVGGLLDDFSTSHLV